MRQTVHLEPASYAGRCQLPFVSAPRWAILDRMTGQRPDLATLSFDDLLATRRRLRRTLAAQSHLQPIRIAVLGGSTTQEFVDFLELTLLGAAFAPSIYQSGFGQYAVEALHDPRLLIDFGPNLIYLHTSVQNLEHLPPTGSDEAALQQALSLELDRFRRIWQALFDSTGCQVIQSNFELPPYASLGSLDAVLPDAHGRFVAELNLLFAREAAAHPRLLLHDLCGVSRTLRPGSLVCPGAFFQLQDRHLAGGFLRLCPVSLRADRRRLRAHPQGARP